MANLNFEPGDEVRMRLARGELDGRILETSESGIWLVKLKTGYNIGIPKENVLAGRVLKKFRAEETEKSLPKKKKGKKTIGLIVTGGTIASKFDSKTGGAKHLTDVKELAKFYPELFEMVNVEVRNPFMIASESMDHGHWKVIAEECEKMLNDEKINGIIITHGTDFLHYTAAALSFFLRKLNKPVVLTYSQRSIDRASSDANLNLQCAAEFALSDCAEVVLVGHADSNDDYCYAMRGTKVKKLHSSMRGAFKPVNSGPLAKVKPGKIEFLESYNSRNNEKVELDSSFSDKVALVKFYPGQSPEVLDHYALKCKGVVIEGSGLGHVPIEDNSWLGKIKKLIKEGFVVCMTTQCQNGRVDPFVYSNGRLLKEAGVIFLEDMLSETAFVKLGWVLGHHGWKGKVEEKMLENFAGEIGDCLRYDED
ncbi:MAG: Glu-tRNA(Gln) amidotransferase subunit GatD [Nanoarchaeota archaeon]|nr:Glu-tRNA(Gln) amidotransferase subunit GatD [Nanoarchaeota archaeon]